MVDLKKIGDEAFPDPEFKEGKEEQVFNVLEVMSNLPCGTNQLLVRQEFETIKCELLMIMSKKWTNVNPETKMPVMGLNLDYQIAGQLSSGKSFFLSYFLVLKILEGQPTIFRCNDCLCYLFDSDSKGSKTDAYSLFDLPKNQKKALWILTDEKLENAGWNMKCHSWFVMQVASPKKLTGQDHLRSKAGWFFEGYAHDWFRKGRSFEADKLPVKNDNPHLTFTTNRSESLNYFMDAKDLARKVQVMGGQGIEQDAIGKYFLPYNTNFESVDRLVFSALNILILLQITITKSHPVKLYQVKSLYQSLLDTIKNIQMVFVIPEDHISEYSRAQSVPEAVDVKPGARDLKINQFRLVLTEATIHSMAVDGPFKVQHGSRGADESGSRDYDRGDTAVGGTQ
ncbi:hypothetical protein L873DRAFT_1879937 [Choiromyces venosus 120613-1]|uniref:Uncharacterized protein n=1 Tax=Choiromyces venosus 120613-1 TaxID=1336337 RepID=A0A3N4IZP3_9PEZI|nr:hypothetical protein L873DRAFT_1879937 [Choiromyces venosus 120613-1]